MTILVTGGMDYIGSHICVKLLNRDYRVVILDNLSNSKIETIARIKLLNKSNKITFYKTDILNYNNLDEMFELEKIDVVVHFADLKAVSESIINPSLYYENNIQGIINLLKVMDKYKIKCLVFSSSATVYSSNSNVPFKEDHFLSPINPYGRTKLFI